MHQPEEVATRLLGARYATLDDSARNVARHVAERSMFARHGTSFNPYPYILLNLFLSMLAAIQAPVIPLSQNRQSEKDPGFALIW